MPVAAIEVKLARKGTGLADPVRASIGQSIIYSVQYPYVIAFVLNKGAKDFTEKHWFDNEIKSSLWNNHRTRLIICQ